MNQMQVEVCCHEKLTALGHHMQMGVSRRPTIETVLLLSWFIRGADTPADQGYQHPPLHAFTDFFQGHADRGFVGDLFEQSCLDQPCPPPPPPWLLTLLLFLVILHHFSPLLPAAIRLVWGSKWSS